VIPGFVLKRIIKNQALARLPESGFTVDPYPAITTRNAEAQMATETQIGRATMWLDVCPR
jgi:hypothetical protein